MIKTHPRDFISIMLLRGVIGVIALTYGFSLTNATRAVFLLRLEPVFVLVASAIFLGEKITSKKIFLSSALIFGAFLITTNGNI